MPAASSAILLAVLAVAHLGNAVYPVSIGLGLLTLLCSLAAFPLGLVLICIAVWSLLRKRWSLRAAAAFLLVGVIWVGWPLLALRAFTPLRHFGLERAAAKASPLIVAIARYERSKGEPPRDLQDLVPEFLTAVPTTGLPAFPDFEYARLGGRRTLHFYDLGSRAGAAMTGLWVYPDGPPDHAILALEVDSSGIVREVRKDRMPANPSGIQFDRARWLDRVDRLKMVHDISSQLSLDRAQFSAVRELLGPTDGERVLVDSRWELRIPCPNGLMNWDVFYYWPSGNYPARSHGGSVVRLGEWAYVHE